MAQERNHLTWRRISSQFTAREGQIFALKQYLRDTRRETGCHLRRSREKAEGENVLCSQYARKRWGWTHRSEMTTGGSPWYLDCPRGHVNTGDTQSMTMRLRLLSSRLCHFFSHRKPWKGRSTLLRLQFSTSGVEFHGQSSRTGECLCFSFAEGKSEIWRKHERSTTRTSTRSLRARE